MKGRRGLEHPPGKEKESNWLAAPKEPCYRLMSLYLPQIEK